MHKPLIFPIAVLLLAACASAPERPASLTAPAPAHAVIGVGEAQLRPEFWIDRQGARRSVVLDSAAIGAQNQRLRQLDPSLHDVEGLPATLAHEQVGSWVSKLSARPERALFDEEGEPISDAAYASLEQNVGLRRIPASVHTRYGMVVRRADLRTFPTRLRVFNTKGDADIDRFQESALFPGTPVAVVHDSTDGRWWFVLSPNYAAWIEKEFVALGDKDRLFSYTRKEPYVVVTGPTARTVHTRERPEVSELQLDMGVKVPLLADWPADRPVNGQTPYAAHVVELPYRKADGTLEFTPALLPKTADVAADYLPLTRENLLRQSFKFLGERYGWGHSYNARDCSGFVSEVYRSFGVQLPRNTSDQGKSPALTRITFTDEHSHEERLRVLDRLHVGDLVYIPGHVMMVIGQAGGMTYVIHDTTGISYRDAGGGVRRVDLNSVSVTPLTPLLVGEGRPMVDRIYSILTLRPSNTLLSTP
jgi:cell wall-associated NlpC family hydrolase